MQVCPSFLSMNVVVRDVISELLMLMERVIYMMKSLHI